MILLDTNVIAETMRPAPDRRVVSWISAAADLYTSAVVIAELTYGIARIAPQQRSARLRANLDLWIGRLRGRIITFDEETSFICGEVRGLASRSGRAMEMPDAMIAATALRHGAALATRNVRDFAVDGLIVIDPWS